MKALDSYRRKALKRAGFTNPGKHEWYARIPGFRGLITSGRTKKEAADKLESALTDWINLALKRGLGLPSVF